MYLPNFIHFHCHIPDSEHIQSKFQQKDILQIGVKSVCDDDFRLFFIFVHIRMLNLTGHHGRIDFNSDIICDHVYYCFRIL